jgi:acyl-CoA thioesterase-1
MSKTDVDAVKAGRPFTNRRVSIISEGKNATGFSRGDTHLVAMFTPNRDDKKNASGRIHFEGRDIPFSLSRKPSIQIISSAHADILQSGYWTAKIYGNTTSNRFIISRAELTEKPDPRQVDDPALPRVLVIGDSISMNYDESAKKALRGKANYHRIEANGGSTGRGVSSLDLWLGPYWEKGFQWDVIQFNHGLHDLNQRGYEKDAVWGDFAVSIEDYKKNLELEIQTLKKTGAQLIWCTTTPVPENPQGTGTRKPDADLIFNKAAMEVMSKHPEIIINDLNKLVRGSAVFDEWRTRNNVHYKTPAELTALGQAVAHAVQQALDKRNADLKK